MAEAPAGKVNFRKGMVFQTYKEFEKHLNEYEMENHSTFYIKDSKSAAAAQKYLVKTLNPAIEYYLKKYHCDYQDTRTDRHKSSCPVHLHVKASTNGNFLEVSSFHGTHNHTIKQEVKDTYDGDDTVDVSESFRFGNETFAQKQEIVIEESDEDQKNTFATKSCAKYGMVWW